MQDLLSIAELTRADIEQLFRLAGRLRNGYRVDFRGLTAVYSFAGSSFRTRVTFLKALAALGITAVELPNLLQTQEPLRHLAGYLDQWVDLYIIREPDHAAVETLAHSSMRPIVNAMSNRAHPCEVLSDGFSLWEQHGSLAGLRFCIVGPPTNVLSSWVALCRQLSLDYRHVVPPELLPAGAANNHHPVTASLEEGLAGAHVVLTDGWPGDSFDHAYQITLEKLKAAAPDVQVIPCPPFDTTREVAAEVIDSPYFAGYRQKSALYFMHMAIIVQLLNSASSKEMTG